LVDKLEDTDVEIISPKTGPFRSAILCFKPSKPREMHNYLMKNNVINTLRRDMIRISLGLYNNEEDINALISYIRKFK